MTVKITVKGKKEPEPKSGIPAIRPPRPKKQQDNIIIRTLKVMLMDIRIRADPQLRKDYGDYARFCELSRGKR